MAGREHHHGRARRPSVSRFTASRRFSGVAARGSIERASLRSSVVIEIATRTRFSLGHRRQQVEVAQDQRRLGDDRERVVEARQHLDHLRG